MRRGRLGFALGIVFWARAGLAADEGPRVALAVTRGDGTQACIRERAIERSVERRLRRPVFVDASSADLSIDVALERDANRVWSAKVTLRGRNGAEVGARELDTRAPHCSALDDALVLVVALLVDSPEARGAVEAATAEAKRAAAGTPPSNVPPPPVVAPSHRAEPSPIELPPETFAPREPYRFELGANVVGLAGAMPGLALGPGLSFGVRPPHFVSVRLRPAIFFPREAHAPTTDRGGRFSLIAVGVDVCPVDAAAGQLSFYGCAGQHVGRVAARGFGFEQTERADQLYYALGVSAGGAFWMAPSLGVALELGAEAPLTRDAYFSMGPAGERRRIFQASALVGAATAGLLLAL